MAGGGMIGEAGVGAEQHRNRAGRGALPAGPAWRCQMGRSAPTAGTATPQAYGTRLGASRPLTVLQGQRVPHLLEAVHQVARQAAARVQPHALCTRGQGRAGHGQLRVGSAAPPWRTPQGHLMASAADGWKRDPPAMPRACSCWPSASMPYVNCATLVLQAHSSRGGHCSVGNRSLYPAARP